MIRPAFIAFLVLFAGVGLIGCNIARQSPARETVSLSYRMVVGATVISPATPAVSEPLTSHTESDGSEVIILPPSMHSVDLTPWYMLNEEKFTSYVDFQQRLRSLPKGTVIRWHRSDVDTWKQPLNTKDEIAAFEGLCRELGLQLIIAGGG